MYFSKKLNQDFLAKITSLDKIIFYSEFDLGFYDLSELESITDLEFSSWEKISGEWYNTYVKKFSGFLRRFLIEYDSEKNLYRPYFAFILVAEKNLDYKQSFLLRENWLKSWVYALKNDKDTNKKIETVENSKISKMVYKFFDDENDVKTILENLNVLLKDAKEDDWEKQEVLQAQIENLKSIYKNRRLFSANGCLKI